MRCCVVTFAVLVVCGLAFPQDRRAAPPLPNQFTIGRHTFFDFGPPFDFYELLRVRQTPNGTSIERITLTPAGDACTQPAKIETASASSSESVAALLGNTNPCTIPEKELRRELKRCKKCLVFSGANVAMQVQCGTETRIVRSDILDKDMFDPAPNTPEHTSWTMQLLGRLDKALGPGVMDKPIFPIAEKEEAPTVGGDSETLMGVSSGRFDTLFQGARNKPSDLYRAAQDRPPAPSVRLVRSSPIQPQEFALPQYPPLARSAHIEGTVVFKLEIDPGGSTAAFTLVSGHPMFRESVKKAVSGWKFSKEGAGQQIEATIEFAANCPSKRQ
jgi:TonB family protein